MGVRLTEAAPHPVQRQGAVVQVPDNDPILTVGVDAGGAYSLALATSVYLHQPSRAICRRISSARAGARASPSGHASGPQSSLPNEIAAAWIVLGLQPPVEVRRADPGQAILADSVFQQVQQRIGTGGKALGLIVGGDPTSEL